ncbi:MAG: agmatinase [Planctomycetaceae bacterium]|nr:agmatinase [Planctomycetaceae bacterium]
MRAAGHDRARFLGLESVASNAADVLLIPVPYEGTVSYGKGTAAAPAAVLGASGELELWDEELDFELDSLNYHVDQPVFPAEGDTPGTFLVRLFGRAQVLSQHPGLLIGVGGEHSLTSALVRGICKSKGIAFSDLTVVHLDAQADLRSEHEGWRQSHVCAMRPLVELGVKLISIGVRSVQREECAYGQETGRVQTFLAQALADDPEQERQLLATLSGLTGSVYLTIDMDALEVHLCPGTGFPHPGGLGWWQVLRYLRTLLRDNAECRLVGCDIVETVPMLGTKVNEFVAARLLAKVLAYQFSRGSRKRSAD